MSKLAGFKEIEVSKRLKRAIQQRGAGENLVKNLAELIKNSDDSYDELQRSGVETSGTIEVGYWQFVKNKRRAINAFFIRDYGVGMSREDAENAFGEKSYGEDTSADRRNGAIGVGGKDAFYGMEGVQIISIRKGVPILIEVVTNEDGVLASKISDNHSFVTTAMSVINNQIRKHCKTLKLDQDGTFVRFRLPESRPGIRFETLRNNLRLYYTLRNITNGANHTNLRLIDVDTGETFPLKYDETESEILQKPDSFQIAHVNKKGVQEHYQVDVLIQRAKDELDKDKEVGENFIIENGQGGILDNYMFGYQNDPAASKIFGKIIIHNWKSLFRDNQGVLPENREGLLWSHPFNKEIETRVIQFIRPIIDTERRKLGPNPETDKMIDKKMKSTLAFLNKLMKEDDFEDEKDEKAPPEVLDFSYGRMKIVPGKTKTVKLLINPLVIPKLTEISTVVTEGVKAGISVEPIGRVKTPDQYNYPPEVPYIKFQITANEEGTDSHLKAYYRNYEPEVTISVVPEDELYPKDGFAFVPSSIRMVRGKEKKLRMVIDTHLFKPGTIIELESEDERIILPFSKITVSQPNMGKYLTEEFLYISCEKSRIKSRILAKTKTVTDDERVAVCKVRVIEKEDSKVFFKDVKLDPSGDPRKRARFNDGYVYIHVLHPVLELYFGSKQEYIARNPTKDAVALLADTVLNIALRQWAKKRIEDGIVDVLDLSRKDEEIDLEKDRLERKYGKQIHQTLNAKYHSDKI